MTRSTKRAIARQFDALLALPLDRFRRALTGLTAEELTALQERLAVQAARCRWARGGVGIARHHARRQLALLARRQTALSQERAARAPAAPPAPLAFPAAADERPAA